MHISQLEELKSTFFLISNRNFFKSEKHYSGTQRVYRIGYDQSYNMHKTVQEINFNKLHKVKYYISTS